MKSYLFKIFFFILLSQYAIAQCTGGVNAGTLSTTNTWQSISAVNGGSYYSFQAIAGNVYFFSFCSSNGGASTYDTQLTILNSFGNPEPNGFNDDFCGMQSSISWTCLHSGTYRVLVTKYNCAAQNNVGKLSYKSEPVPACPTGLGNGVTTISSLPFTSGSGTTAGAGNDLTSFNLIAGGAATFFAGEDKVWIFSPSVGGNCTITLSTTASNVNLSLYQGCPLIGNKSACLAYAQGTGTQTLTTCLQQGLTYYVVVDSKSPTLNFNYSFLSITAPSSTGACSLNANVTIIPKLPYAFSGCTTCGKGDHFTTSNVIACGNPEYLSGEDEIYSFVPATSGNISINLTTSGSYSGMFLFEGCPMVNYCSGTGGIAISNATGPSGSKSLCANVTAGRVYYLIVDNWGSCMNYALRITNPIAAFPGATCANPVVISSLPFKATKESTACFGDDYNNYVPGTAGTIYESGEDKVYKYVATNPSCLGITLSGCSSNNISYLVYNGVPGTAGVTCIAHNGGGLSGSLTGSVVLPSAGTYYIMVDSWADPLNVNYNLEINSYGTSAINDLPCNALSVAIGNSINGDNNCSAGTMEPAAPACWGSLNTLNTVWFKFSAPPSGSVTLKTTSGTLKNTLLAVYAGTCGTALTLVNCNDDAAVCGTTTATYSKLMLAGLTSGADYYVAVDGYKNTTGSFSLSVYDGAVAIPPVYGQESTVPMPVCSSPVLVGNPGFQANGNVCDFVGGNANCLLSGERGSAWYVVRMQNAGSLEFSLTPNDWDGAPSTNCTDYDFAIWKTGGTGAVTTAQIMSGIAPIRCNYSSLGVTGLFGTTNGVAPAGYPGFGAAYQSQIPVANGDEYTLLISNYSNSNSGFRLDFSPASPINYATLPATVAWSGSVDNDWFKPENWGGCAIPNCTINAVITPASANQPVINKPGAIAKSLFINPGASVSYSGNNNLTICANGHDARTTAVDSAIFYLLSFTAEVKGKTIVMKWFTSAEVNSKGFEIQRATNPAEFETINWVDGNGTTSMLHDYMIDDDNVQPNRVYYYRLHYVDNNGNSSNSKTVACIVREQGVVVFEVYPNPFKESTDIQYLLSHPSEVTVDITDMTGKRVKHYQQGLQSSGRYAIHLVGKEDGMPAGIYTVTLWCDDQRFQKQITEID